MEFDGALSSLSIDWYSKTQKIIAWGYNYLYIFWQLCSLFSYDIFSCKNMATFLVAMFLFFKRNLCWYIVGGYSLIQNRVGLNGAKWKGNKFSNIATFYHLIKFWNARKSNNKYLMILIQFLRSYTRLCNFLNRSKRTRTYITRFRIYLTVMCHIN